MGLFWPGLAGGPNPAWHYNSSATRPQSAASRPNSCLRSHTRAFLHLKLVLFTSCVFFSLCEERRSLGQEPNLHLKPSQGRQRGGGGGVWVEEGEGGGETTLK